MPCKGICHRYKARKPPLAVSRYDKGQKRCNTCGIFIEWEGIHCPCCSRPVRTRPRGSRLRRNLETMKNIRRI